MQTVTVFYLELVCSLVAVAVMAFFKREAARRRSFESGIQALLRDRIVQAYYHYYERNWITLHGLENVEALYEQYHALGGNGPVTKLVEDLRKMEVKM